DGRRGHDRRSATRRARQAARGRRDRARRSLGLTARSSAADSEAMLAASGSFYFLTSFLPFVLLFGFWMLVARNVRSRMPAQRQALVDQPEEVLAELERPLAA